MTPDGLGEDWQTYPTRIDGSPAMIFVNMAAVQAMPVTTAPQLSVVSINMLDPGDNGMGTSDESESFAPIEDALCEVAAAHQIFFPGRLRRNGTWELVFQGPAEVPFAAVLDDLPGLLGERVVSIDCRPDPEWQFCRDTLAPNREQWQLILDYRVVHQLMDAGDNPDLERPVDHFARFSTEAELNAVSLAANAKGFSEQSRNHDDDPGHTHTWWLGLQRADRVRIGDIHPVVMSVVELVEQHNGKYDGWGCPIAR